MAFIVNTLTFDTGLWESTKKFLVKLNRGLLNHGYAQAAAALDREGLSVEAARLRNEIKLGGIN